MEPPPANNDFDGRMLQIANGHEEASEAKLPTDAIKSISPKIEFLGPFSDL